MGVAMPTAYVKHETQYGRFATAQPPFFVDEQADGWMHD